MTTFSSFPSIFVPLVGLVFSAIAMASLSFCIMVQFLLLSMIQV